MDARLLAIFLFLLIVHNIHGIINLPVLIEQSLRGYRGGAMMTDETHFIQRPLLAEYDFVVIGSGPGGSTVANRLSENPNWSVLLLEAGKEESILLDIPMFVPYNQFTDYNWGFMSEPEPGACLGLKDKRCRWPRGKSLGGTTSINYMIYTRGHREDYNEWARNGNIGWSYDDLLPYFLKSENSKMQDLENSPNHRKGGYLNVERVPYRTKLMEAFLKAGPEMGMPVIDYNDGNVNTGVSSLQETMQRGHRQSAAKAFLRPVKNRDNLHISTKSRVTKILIDPATKTAYGVEVVKNRITYTIRTRKEVILSAGALASPQLLMLSGVGPRAHLEELGIPVIQDLHVGENLQEHVSYAGLVFVSNESYTGIVESRLMSPQLAYQFLARGEGPLTLPGAVEGLGYIHTKYNKDPWNRPDIEFIFASGSLASEIVGTVKGGIGVSDEIYQKYFRPVEDRDSWTIWPMLLQPKSRGCVKLASNNPWKWPKFYANYFQSEDDLNRIVEGIKAAIELSQAQAFKRYGSTLHPIPLPGCESVPYATDDYWKCVTRQITTTLHHQSGTCKMGPETDPTAVVSPELKVYGINNLRVVDASIIPILPTAHITAPTYMIGEKGSDLIKASWNYTIHHYSIY